MEIYGGQNTKALTPSYILWPLLATCLAGALYFYIDGLIPNSPVVDNTESLDTATLHKQLIVANVLSAFEEATTTVEAILPLAEIIEPAPAPVTAAPVLAPKLKAKELTKTSRRTALPKITVPKFTIALATSSDSIKTTVASSTNTSIQQLFEVKIPGGGGSGGGSAPVVSSGGGSSSPAPAPSPAPTPAPAPVVTVPDAPTSPFATGGNATTTVSWVAPASNGGATITDYEIRQSTDNFSSDNTIVSDGIGASTSYIVTGLTNGTTYYFKISAVNSAGTSTASSVVNATPAAPAVAATVPRAPTLQSATAGNATTTLVWAVPSSNGGSGLTDYEIRQSTDNFASDNTVVNDGVGTSSTSYIVTGLTNGTQYYFKISAVNAVGTGDASNVLSATPVAPAPTLTTPGAPTNLLFAEGDSSFDLAWTAPVSDGGSAITDYEVHYSTKADFSADDNIFAHTASTDTSITVDSGVVNDVPYYVRVKAVNAVGTGVASAITGPVTPTGVGSGI